MSYIMIFKQGCDGPVDIYLESHWGRFQILFWDKLAQSFWSSPHVYICMYTCKLKSLILPPCWIILLMMMMQRMKRMQRMMLMMTMKLFHLSLNSPSWGSKVDPPYSESHLPHFKSNFQELSIFPVFVFRLHRLFCTGLCILDYGFFHFFFYLVFFNLILKTTLLQWYVVVKDACTSDNWSLQCWHNCTSW